MKGKVQIKIKNRKCQFEFEIERNITIVRGDSGTGKTTLFNMISEYTRLKEESGINLQCSKKCIALTAIDWEHQLEQAKDSVVFIDEGDRFVSSKDFANIIRNSDNYYVLFVRENLHELPYSVNEIYEIHTSGKIHTFKIMQDRLRRLLCCSL
ncbi:MAG: AAA family ATPase [Lachnospiraceae bacterium]|nr:AAA family ATPase [Lachnospiraceae bacterium]